MSWVFLPALLLSLLHIRVPEDEVHLGDRVTVLVEAEAPSGYLFDLDSLKGGLSLFSKGVGSFSIVDESNEQLEGGLCRATFVLEAWRLGTTHFGFFPARLTSEQGPPIECYGSVVALTVLPNEPMGQVDPAPLVPLSEAPLLALDLNNRLHCQKELRETDERLKDALKSGRLLLYLALGSLTVLGIVFAVRKLRPLRRTLTLRDPVEEALKALEELAAKRLPDKGAFEDFYVLITQIIRNFIENKYQIHAPEQTTEEFLRVAHDYSAFDAATKGLLREFLSLADLVKFARLSPSFSECDGTMKAAHQLISRSQTAS